MASFVRAACSHDFTSARRWTLPATPEPFDISHHAGRRWQCCKGAPRSRCLAAACSHANPFINTTSGCSVCRPDSMLCIHETTPWRLITCVRGSGTWGPNHRLQGPVSPASLFTRSSRGSSAYTVVASAKIISSCNGDSQSLSPRLSEFALGSGRQTARWTSRTESRFRRPFIRQLPPQSPSMATAVHVFGGVSQIAQANASQRDASGGSLTAVPDPRVVQVYDLSQQVVEYERAWAWQRALLDRVIAAAGAGAEVGDAVARPPHPLHSLLLLQHPPVYTLGAGSSTDHLRFPPGACPIPLYRTERGGEVTYHGPGQLVMYPILNLHALSQPDLHWYLRQLEQVVIEALDAVSGIHGERLEGLTGVWVGGAKVAAIGVRAKRWVSYHGLALNVVTDLAPFAYIVPCGIADRSVTSVKRLLQLRTQSDDPFAPSLEQEHSTTNRLEAATVAGIGEELNMAVPLAEATQEDLCRMVSHTGMMPLVMGASDAAGIRAPLELEDPFAPVEESSLQSEARSTAPGSSDNAFPANKSTAHEASASTVVAAVVGGAAAGISQLEIRSHWTEVEQWLLREYACALLDAFADVFQVQLMSGDAGEIEKL